MIEGRRERRRQRRAAMLREKERTRDRAADAAGVLERSVMLRRLARDGVWFGDERARVLREAVRLEFRGHRLAATFRNAWC